jgi:hypothetical protein
VHLLLIVAPLRNLFFLSVAAFDWVAKDGAG